MDKNRMWVETLWDPLNEKNNSPLESKKPGIRVAAYCRISNVRNNFSSLLNQVNYYTNFIRSKPNWKFVGIYFDNGVSGATYSQRPGFKRMLRHCEEGRIDLILTKSVSRFSRNTKELMDVVNLLNEKKVAIYFEKENIDTSSRNYNQLLLNNYAAIAQEEIESASQLTKWGYEKRFMKGIPMYGEIFGYEINNNKGQPTVKINEYEAKIVRWIFDKFLNGNTYVEIARQLMNFGVITVFGNKIWTGVAVKKIITNIAYTGDKIARTTTKDILTNKIRPTEGQRELFVFENIHPAIVNKDIYNEAQKRVQKVSRKNVKGNGRREIKTLSDRIICGYCNQKYYSRSKTRWKCKTSIYNKRFCNAKMLNEEIIRSMILKAFHKRFDFTDTHIIKDLLKILQRVNQNDNFEFHRLKYFAEIEIASRKIADDSNKRVKEIEEEYAKFEKRVSQIEDDRVYRDLAIVWLRDIQSVNEFEDNITIEYMRAWAISIQVYSGDAYVVKWIDEKETVVNKEKIESIKKAFKEKQTVALDLSEDDTWGNKDSLESFPFLFKGVSEMTEKIIGNQFRDNFQDNYSKEISNCTQDKQTPEVITLEPGLGVLDVKNVKENLAKIKTLNLLDENKKKLKVASYCRVSTHLEQQYASLQTQIAYYTYFILKNPKWSFVGIFADKGESGTTVKCRDDFNRMINEAKAGKIDLIITKSISRFSRNVVDVLETIKTLRELPNPVHCYFEKENINTADSKSDMLITLMSSVAQNEITTLSSSITWGIQKLAQSGIIHRTTDFYGYTIDKSRTWKIVPKEAEVIRWVAKEFLNKKSYREIIKKLYDKQIKSPSGQDYWNDSQIREMLKNEKYKGDYLFQKSYTPDIIGSKPKTNNGKVAQYYIEKHHPAIIDEKEWRLIQDEMKSRAREVIKDAKPAQTAGRKCFYNKFSCSECGGVITRYSGIANSREGSKWRCYNSYGTMNVVCHNNVAVRQDYLELNFMKTLIDIGKRKEFVIEVEQQIENLKLTKLERLREKKIKEEIEALNQQLYVAVDNQIAKEGYDTQKIEILTGEIIKLQKELKVLSERLEEADYYRKELKQLLNICKAIEPINFRDFHHMDVRIKPGDSIYNTTKVAKDSTYIKKNQPDNFLEEIFNKYITKGQIDNNGRVAYNFIFGIDYGIKMTYKEYLDESEKTKAEINLEELLISKEVRKLKGFCKEAKYAKEMRDFLNISSKVSFSRRILKPLFEAGKLKLIGEHKGSDWRYYWNGEND